MLYHKPMVRIGSCLLMILFVAASADAYDFSPQSSAQVTKQAQRWSLSQWMEQKGKLQWMDLWLNSNVKSPSFYEIYLGADYSVLDQTLTLLPSTTTTTDDIASRSGHLGLFVSIFGVYGRYEKSADNERVAWDAVAQLRLLGANDQGSNLTLFYGLRGQEIQSDESQHQQAGGYLTLYLLQPWAIQGRYSQFLEATSKAGVVVKGHRLEASTWLEWGPIRFYGTWFKEPLELSAAGVPSELTTEGYSLGIRTYLDFKK
jgi:hypothetical protein